MPGPHSLRAKGSQTRVNTNNPEICLKKPLLFAITSTAGAVTRKVVATETRPPQTPLSLTGKDGFLTPPQTWICLGFLGSSSVGRRAPSSLGAWRHLLSSRVIVHRWVDLETWWLALWGFGNCLRVVRGSSFICHHSHCEEHFMPREFLALNPGICHKMPFSPPSFLFC